MQQPSPATLRRASLAPLSPLPPSSRSHGHITGGNASGTLFLALCQLDAALGDSPFSLLSLAGRDTPAAALDQCQSCGALLMSTSCVKAGTPHMGIMGQLEFHCPLPACASMLHVGCADRGSGYVTGGTEIHGPAGRSREASVAAVGADEVARGDVFSHSPSYR